MPKNRYYYYDHEACTFMEVQPSRSRFLMPGVSVLALTLLFSSVGVWALSRNVTTPTELAQGEEIEALRDQLAGANTRLSTFSEQLAELAETDRDLYRTVLNAEPITEDEFQVGVGGSRSRQFDRFSAPTGRLLRQTEETFDRLERQVAVQSASFEDLKRLATRREAIIRQQPAILPTGTGRLTSGYGMRYHPILHTSRMHAGVDFSVRLGTPIYATGDGVVSFVGTKSGYGNVVELSHPLAGRRTRYAHLTRAAEGIEAGTRVRRGQVIAYSGNTGLSTAPHLHYEVRRLDTDEPLNPISSFVPGVSPREYRELLEMATRETASFD